MTEQDAREALRERLAEALRRDRDVNLPMNDPLDVSITDVVNALMPAVKEYAAEQVKQALTATADAWQWGEWANAPRLPDRIAERIAHAQHVTEWLRARAALDGSPAGSGDEEAGR